ncbi:MAG: helix-turn-helix transcriptional regulator, partial [Clostridia bacterium]|nr:helix-turn-helix transcriptional regulator [Clostridia bacterium]
VIGYMMLGQITDVKDKDQLCAQMEALRLKYGIQDDLEGAVSRIKYKNTHQIKAAAKIRAACTEYVRLKEMVRPVGRKIIDALSVYVEEHMRENIDVEHICSHFHISRTGLYEALHPYFDGGVAAFVKQKRLEKAKELAENTDMTVADVVDTVGFSDYNYFLRVFKQHFGVSFGKVRKASRGEKA